MKIVLHGNCQCLALSGYLREAVPAWTCQALTVHSWPEERLDEYREHVATADIIISQPVSKSFRKILEFETEWVRQAAKKSVVFISFPSIYFQGDFPTMRRVAGIPGNITNYVDVALAKMFADGLTREVAVERLLSPEFMGAQQLNEERETSLTELQKRERLENLDVRVSGYISDRCMEQSLFYTVNHPCRAILAHVANQIFARLGATGRCREDGIEYMAFESWPVLPCVSRRYALHGARDSFKVRESATPAREYYGGAYDLLAQRGRDFVAKALANVPGDLERLWQETVPDPH